MLMGDIRDDSCGMQYGFKNKYVTNLCTVVKQKIVQHYRKGQGNIIMCIVHNYRS